MFEGIFISREVGNHAAVPPPMLGDSHAKQPMVRVYGSEQDMQVLRRTHPQEFVANAPQIECLLRLHPSILSDFASQSYPSWPRSTIEQSGLTSNNTIRRTYTRLPTGISAKLCHFRNPCSCTASKRPGSDEPWLSNAAPVVCASLCSAGHDEHRS